MARRLARAGGGLLSLAIAAGGQAHADSAAAPSEPVWEAGPGLALLGYPDYRGAQHYNFKPLPLPYLIYRGDRLHVSREGLKADLLERANLQLSLSAAFALPGRSDNADSPRAGMPKLMPTFEIGPSLDWWLTEPEYYGWNYRLRLPVRAVGATDFREAQHVGWLTHPHFLADWRARRGDWTLHFAAGAGALFANRSYHAYFYQVKPQYATPERPAYEPDAGYSGARFSAWLGARRGRWGVGIGILDDWLSGAAFVDSPLVETRNAAVVGLGLTYRLWQSDETVADAPQ